jgi:hypothetical protein
MTIVRHARKLATHAALVALCSLSFIGSSYAQATVSNFSFQNPISGTETGIVGCFPDLTGTITGTETVVGHSVDTGHGSHVSGTDTQNYRIDFVDGRYLVSSSPALFEFNTNLLGRTVYNDVQRDRASLYNAEGTPIGTVTVFNITHITWNDTNGNGNPDPGEITADVSDFRMTCP